jgi:hypothetical protein
MATAGAVVMSPACAGLFPCDPEQAVSTPSTAIPAIATANPLRFNLLATRFMNITLPSAVNRDNDAGRGLPR